MASWSSVWQQAVTLLVGEGGISPGFDAWLRRARPLSLADRRLVVEVDDPFTRDWVRARYQPALEAYLQRLLGFPCELELVVADPPAEGRSPDPTSSPPSASSDPEEGEEPTGWGGSLNPRYTFDNFVVGNSNRFAYSACRGVVLNPGGPYNPLFIYGGVGLGKTHLLQAVAHEVLKIRPAARVVYVTTEEFTNDLVDSLQRKSMPAFRSRYRSAEVLLLDDVHFVGGKESTQEEFFHTFNALYEAGRQIVLSSDRPPSEIPRLEERLRSRFAWGLLADIQPPDFETRLAILRQRAAGMGAEVPDEVLRWIAEQIRSNIRVLEGALRRVLTAARLQAVPPSLELAAAELKDLSELQRQPLTIERVQEVVAAHFGLRASDLKSKARARDLTFARQVAMLLCRELTHASLPYIGQQFGGRDHSTVLHSIGKVQAKIRTDPEVAELLRHLRQRLLQGG